MRLRSLWFVLALVVFETGCLDKVQSPWVGSDNFSVRVDYDASPSSMIEAGKYVRVDSAGIEECLLLEKGSGTKKVTIKLVWYEGRPATFDDVIADLDSRGMRPATISELLALVAQYPDANARYDLLALGSTGTSYGHPAVPIVWGGWQDKRRLTLWELYEDPLDGFAYLAVRKESAVR